MISLNHRPGTLVSQSQDEFLTVGQISAAYGLSGNTVRSLANSGVLVVGRLSDQGWRRISRASVVAHLGLPGGNTNQEKDQEEKKIVGLHRKSSGSKADLEPGIKELRDYAKEKYGVNDLKVYADLASHLSLDNRKQFMALLDEVFSGSISRIIILYKDRLSRLPMHSMIEKIVGKFGCVIEYVHTQDEGKDSIVECTNDLISYLHCVSCRVYSKRAADRRRIVLPESAKILIQEKINLGWGANRITQELNAKGFVGTNGKGQERKIELSLVARFIRQYGKTTNKILPISLTDLITEFRDQKLTNQEKGLVPQKELYLLFQQWCRSKNLPSVPTRYSFNQTLRGLGVSMKKRHTDRTWCWTGVSLV